MEPVIGSGNGRGDATQKRALAAVLLATLLVAGCETVQQTIETIDEVAARTFAASETAEQGAPSEAREPAPAAGVEPVVAADERVGRVQARLAELGYEPGPVDGLMGPKTRAAIRSFQANSGLAVDGEVSGALLARLAAPPAPPVPPVPSAPPVPAARDMALSTAGTAELPAPSYAVGSRYVYAGGEVRTVLGVDGRKVRWRSSRRGETVAYDNFLLPPLAWSTLKGYGTRTYRTAPEGLWPAKEGAELGFSATAVTRRGPQPENRSAVDETWRCRLDGVAEVAVKAGTFETRKIRCEERRDPVGSRRQRTWYYAPDIRHYVLFEETRGAGAAQVREELVAVQPGTADWPPVARAGLGWAFDHALETAAPGEATSWTSSAFDIQVATVPGPRQGGGRKPTCRTFRQIWSEAGATRTYRGLACRAASGHWTIPGLDSDPRVASKAR